MKNKVWSFLNSNFGIWFLSSIVLSALTFSYSSYENYQERVTAQAGKILKLDIEISNRLDILSHALLNRKSDPKKMQIALLSMANPGQATYPVHVYEEYKNRTTQSLFWELYSLSEDKSKNELKFAAQTSMQLFKEYQLFGVIDNLGQESPFKVIIEAFSDAELPFVKSSLLEIKYKPLNLARWGKPFDSVFEDNVEDIEQSDISPSPMQRVLERIDPNVIEKVGEMLTESQTE